MVGVSYSVTDTKITITGKVGNSGIHGYRVLENPLYFIARPALKEDGWEKRFCDYLCCSITIYENCGEDGSYVRIFLEFPIRSDKIYPCY